MNRIFLLGTVKSTKDPEKLGRVQVEFTLFGKPITSPFLRSMVPYTGDQASKSGWLFLPEKGDEVVCLCPAMGDELQAEDLANLIVIGAVYNGKRKPAYSNDDDKNAKRQLLTNKGNGFAFDDVKKTVTITCMDDKTSVAMNAEKKTIVITSGSSTVTIGEKNIEVKTDSKGLVLKTSGDLTIDATKKVSIKGKGVAIDAGASPCDIKGSAVNIC